MSEKLFKKETSFIKLKGPKGPINIPATKNPRIKGCLRMYAIIPTDCRNKKQIS